MATTISAGALSIGPSFRITREEFNLDFWSMISDVNIDGVKPPIFGKNDGSSYIYSYTNQWFPWIDEKIVEPKYDGACLYLGQPSNRPSFIKDYHVLTLFRAADRIMSPSYIGQLQVFANTPTPFPPPPPSGQ